MVIPDATCANKSKNCSACKKNKSIGVIENDFLTKLLGRETTPIYSLKVNKIIKNKVILVTGPTKLHFEKHVG